MTSVFGFDTDDAVGGDDVDGFATTAAPTVKDAVALHPVFDNKATVIRRSAHRAMPWLVAQMERDMRRVGWRGWNGRLAYEAERPFRSRVRQGASASLTV
jgi:hypothetical protein